MNLYYVGIMPTKEEIKEFAKGFFDEAYFADRYMTIQADIPEEAEKCYCNHPDLKHWLREDEKRFVRAKELQKFMVIRRLADNVIVKKVFDITGRNETAVEILERGLLRNMNRKEYFAGEAWINTETGKEVRVYDYRIVNAV